MLLLLAAAVPLLGAGVVGLLARGVRRDAARLQAAAGRIERAAPT